jgi:hypothetical protein
LSSIYNTYNPTRPHPYTRRVFTLLCMRLDTVAASRMPKLALSNFSSHFNRPQYEQDHGRQVLSVFGESLSSHATAQSHTSCCRGLGQCLTAPQDACADGKCHVPDANDRSSSPETATTPCCRWLAWMLSWSAPYLYSVLCWGSPQNPDCPTHVTLFPPRVVLVCAHSVSFSGN